MDWHGRLQTQIAQTDEQIWEFKEQIEESTRTTKEEKRNIQVYIDEAHALQEKMENLKEEQKEAKIRKIRVEKHTAEM